MAPMRVLILGSLVPQTARTVWRLLAAGHEIEELWIGENSGSVWRRRDRRLRWLAPTWSIEAAVRRCGVRMRRVGPLRRDPRLVAAACRPQVDAVLGSCFPYVVPEPMLSYYAGRACNLHPALLPRYRGPRPMTKMVFDEALDASGMTLHVMSARCDEGDLIAQTPVPWPADGWFRSWEADLAEAAGGLAANVLPRFLAGAVAAAPQQGQASYAHSLPDGALTVNDRMDARRARWLGASLGRIKPLAVPTTRGLVGVGRVDAMRGAPTGALPAVRWRRVDCDVADARLSFERWTRLHRRAERLRELIALARRPLAA
jgi:folate-dependent phosphoribosylglycinamide formyltransferase PurN